MDWVEGMDPFNENTKTSRCFDSYSVSREIPPSWLNFHVTNTLKKYKWIPRKPKMDSKSGKILKIGLRLIFLCMYGNQSFLADATTLSLAASSPLIINLFITAPWMQALFGIYQRVHTRANHIVMQGKLMNGSSRRDQRHCPSGKTVQGQTNRKPKGLVP